MTASRLLSAALAAALGLAACGPPHIATYEPKRRSYDLPEASPEDAAPQSPGSLWRGDGAGEMLFADARAFRVNDVLVVEIEEKADARRAADTDLERQSDVEAKLDAFLGLVSRLQAAGVDPSLKTSAGTAFTGEGRTARSERVEATVPAVVRKVLPNGNLFIEGHRVVLVNDEEQHFYISGVVRPIDIDQNDSVKSSRVADAEIEFTGRGVLTDNQRQGWFSRLLAWVWPF